MNLKIILHFCLLASEGTNLHFLFPVRVKGEGGSAAADVHWKIKGKQISADTAWLLSVVLPTIF